MHRKHSHHDQASLGAAGARSFEHSPAGKAKRRGAPDGAELRVREGGHGALERLRQHRVRAVVVGNQQRQLRGRQPCQGVARHQVCDCHRRVSPSRRAQPCLQLSAGVRCTGGSRGALWQASRNLQGRRTERGGRGLRVKGGSRCAGSGGRSGAAHAGFRGGRLGRAAAGDSVPGNAGARTLALARGAGHGEAAAAQLHALPEAVHLTLAERAAVARGPRGRRVRRARPQRLPLHDRGGGRLHLAGIRRHGGADNTIADEGLLVAGVWRGAVQVRGRGGGEVLAGAGQQLGVRAGGAGAALGLLHCLAGVRRAAGEARCRGGRVGGERGRHAAEVAQALRGCRCDSSPLAAYLYLLACT